MRFRDVTPHLLPLGWFTAVATASLGPAIWAGRVPWYSDVRNVFHPLRAFAHRCLERGSDPLWNGHAALGNPYGADPQAAYCYPPNWILDRMDPGAAIPVEIILHLVIGAVLVYATALAMRLSRNAAVIGGTAFALCGMMLIQAQAPANLRSAAWAPASCLGAALLATGRLRTGFACASVGWAMSVTGGHLQSAVTLAPPAVAIALGGEGRTMRERLKSLALLGMATASGTLLAGPALLPAIEVTRLSQRSEGVARSLADGEAARAAELLDFGWQRVIRMNGWGPFAFVSHLALTFAAAAAALRTPWWKALAISSAFCLVAALGPATPLGDWIADLPPWEYFRYTGRHAGGAVLAICLLAAAGADRWLRGERTLKARLAVAAATAAFLVVAAAVDFEPLTLRETVRLAIVAAGLTLFVAGPGGRIAARTAAVAATAIIAADLLVLGGGFWWDRDRQATCEELRRGPDALRSVPEDARDGSYRVMTGLRPYYWHNMVFGQGIDNVRGHLPMNPMRLLEFMWLIGEGVPRPTGPIKVPHYNIAPPLREHPLLDLMAFRYVVTPDTPIPATWRPIADGIWERDCRMGLVARVSAARWVPDRNAAALALLETDRDPVREVVLEGGATGGAAREGSAGTTGTARLLSRTSEGLVAETESAAPGWLHVSWNHDPGFTATVDGAPAAVLHANLAFMAVPVPAGRVTVVLRYSPSGRNAGWVLFAVGAAALAAAVVPFRRSRRADARPS